MAETKTNKPANKVKFTEKVAKFFREYKSEMKKISWCKPAQTINNTWAVIVASVAIAVGIGVLDYLFSNGIRLIAELI